MSVKLTAGISIILILAVILALNNFFSINHINMRADNAENVSEVVERVNELTISSLQFKLTFMDKYITEAQVLVEKVKTAAINAKKLLTETRSHQAIEQMLVDMEEYEQALANYVQAQRNKENNLAAAVSSGANTNAALAELNRKINGTALNPIIHNDIYSTTTGRLVTDFVESRKVLAYLARVNLMDETELSSENLEREYSELIAIAAKLQSRLTGSAEELVKGVVIDVEQYMDLLRNMAPLMAAQIEAEKQMDDVYFRVQGGANKLLDRVRELRQQGVSSSKTNSALLTIVAVVIGALIGWFIIKQIMNPLNQAVTIAQAIGERDMTGKIVGKRGDEFGVLLNALEQTRANLRDALGEISGFTSQLAAAAEELSAVTTQTSAGVHSQREETEQVASAMNEMTATVNEVAQNAEKAAVAVEKANRLAINGEKVLHSVLESNNRLTDQVQKSSEAMYRLNEDSENISTVLTVINSIAEQTNLLALNAAIEAARAGDAGRGFAVVADEVRGLAHRTQESTAQVEELISNLQSGSNNAVVMMDNSSKLSATTLELVQEASNELQAIVRTVSEIQTMGMQIATAAEEQSLVAEEINRNVVNVNSIADQSAAAVEETAASSHELARLGQELRNLVSRFKI